MYTPAARRCSLWLDRSFQLSARGGFASDQWLQLQWLQSAGPMNN